MDKIKEFFNKPINLGILGLVVGLVIGLVGLGWGLWPLQWLDASPTDLQEDYQRDYLCMTIDSFTRNPDPDLLAVRWIGLGENAETLLNSLTPAACRFENEDAIIAFKDIVSLQEFADAVAAGETTEQKSVEDIEDSVVVEAPTTGMAGMAAEEPEEPTRISILPLAILILATHVVGGILIFVVMKRAKGGQGVKIRAPKIVIPKKQAQTKTVPDAETKSAAKDHSPLAQFMTTYRQGDDLYDDSFSIDSLNGEFLGECGVGIAETIGVGEPKKVTALEVWLFDKNDIQTVTKVLMSEHANNDPSLRQRLLSKGEPILIEPGMNFLMETETLQLEARVVDMVYARGPLPENSYFSRLTLEISVWSK